LTLSAAVFTPRDSSSHISQTYSLQRALLVDSRGPHAGTHNKCKHARPVFDLLTHMSIYWDLDEKGNRPTVIVVDTHCSSVDVYKSHPTHGRAYTMHVHLVHYTQLCGASRTSSVLLTMVPSLARHEWTAADAKNVTPTLDWARAWLYSPRSLCQTC
jgi:hypothetical protein